MPPTPSSGASPGWANRIAPVLEPRTLLRWLAAGAVLYLVTAAVSIPVWRVQFARARDDGRLAAWTNRRAERVRLEWQRVESPWPGYVEVDGLRVAGRTERRLWEVTARRVSGRLEPLPLLARELRFAGIRAEGVAVRVAAAVAEERAGLLARLPQGESPSIGGFPPGPAPSLPARRLPWSFGFHDVEIEDATEVWMDDRILRGRIAARGGFETRRRRTARIFSSRIELEGASLVSGGEVVASSLDGVLRLESGPYPYRAVELDRLLAALSAEVELEGNLDARSLLEALLAPWPTLEVDGRALGLRLALRLDGARLGVGSRVELADPEQQVRFLGFDARGDARLSGEVVRGSSGPEVETRLLLGDWRLGRPGEAPLLYGRDLVLRARSRALAWGERPAPLSLDIDLGKASVPELGFVNGYLPPAAETRLVSGRAGVSGSLRLTDGGRSATGEIAVRGDGLELEALGQRLAGRIEADVRLSEPDLGARSFSLAGTRLTLRELAATTSEGERLAGWWGDVTLTRGRVGLERPVTLAGGFRARLADTRPLVAFYEVHRDLPGWVERLLTIQGVSASGAFTWAPGRFELTRSEVPLPVGELKTRLLFEGDRRLGRLLARWHQLAVGVEIEDGDRRLRLRDAADWYAEPAGAEGVAADPE